jgi:hypothetical protein
VTYPAPTPSPKVAHLRSKVGATRRHYGADDPRSVEAVRELREAMAGEAIQKIVSAAPPLSIEQKARLAILLLRPTGDGGRAA